MLFGLKINPQKSQSITAQSGMTLSEFLIVAGIIAVLLLVLLLNSRTQLSRARDAERKADLEKIKIAFEDYFNDNNCYPPEDTLNACNSNSFAPYLQSVPCDPLSNQPYLYKPLSDNTCGGYRVYADLEDETDPVISALNCDGEDGCGWGPDYNYGISAGTAVYDPDGTYTPPAGGSSQPTASPAIIYVYACDTAGTCNQYEEGHPFLEQCPTTFEDRHCSNQCGNSANWCDG